MGKYLFDQFTFLHFSTGVVFYFFGLKLYQWFILHNIFEFVENTQFGMNIINTYFRFWPGGKPFRDSFTNIIGDNIGAILGWVVAYYIDKIGSEKGYYSKHMK